MTLLEALKPHTTAYVPQHYVEAVTTPEALAIIRRYAGGDYEMSRNAEGEPCYRVYAPENYHKPL